MSFYEELSSVYDIVFPEDVQTTDFLNNSLPENALILDLACGTGSYSIALSEKGHQVIGIDLDGAMIENAKLKNHNGNVKFYANDMLKFEEVVGQINFDLIYCIGNSLVHLANTELIQELASKVHDSLKKDGEFIIQIINYDRILKNSIMGLPTIERKDDELKFIRKYNLDTKTQKISFDTELIIKENGIEKKYENSVALLPIRSNQLLQILIKAGFPKIGIHGDFADEEFNEDSYVLVLRAVK